MGLRAADRRNCLLSYAIDKRHTVIVTDGDSCMVGCIMSCGHQLPGDRSSLASLYREITLSGLSSAARGMRFGQRSRAHSRAYSVKKTTILP